MAHVNPLKRVYDGLWTILEAHSGFTAIVAAGNRIKFTKGLSDANKKRNPVPGVVQDGSFPQVRIVPAGADAYLRNDSTGTRLDLFYRIEARTAEKQYDDLGLLTWEILRAMADWGSVVVDGASGTLSGGTLTWAAGKTFTVTDVALQQRQDRIAVEKEIPGWHALWRGRVRLDFETSDL